MHSNANHDESAGADKLRPYDGHMMAEQDQAQTGCTPTRDMRDAPCAPYKRMLSG